jgi:YVTN family beta-propeller protein
VGALRADPRIGTEVSGYRIVALLGQGGMSVVYLAEDPRLHRKVALKLIAPDLAQDERFRDRFLAESELAASLDHPNVVPIYEAGESDGALFIAMRYVEGDDLKELLEDGALPPERGIALCAQIAAALDAAHARGLVHRDVKPSNVLIDRQAGPADHVYLADFGLTRRLTDQGGRLGTGLSLGTPAYVAPEQIEGTDVDGRADQYSLGCLLFECLTGQPPFELGSEAATLFAHLDEQPPSVRERRPELPDAIDSVVAKALAKDRAERYPTCREFVEEAREALGIGRSVPSWRARLLVGLVGAILAAAALLAFFHVRGGGTPAPPRSGGSLVRIDPKTNSVAATIPVGKNPRAVAVGKSGVWVANRGDGTISRIDPRTNEVELEVAAQGAPGDIAVAPAAYLFASETPVVANGPHDANIAVFDGRTGAEQNVISLAAGGSFNGFARVAAGKFGVWVAAADRRVGRLNTGAGTLADAVLIEPLLDERADSYFSGIAVSEEGVWVAGDPLDPSVWRIDRATGDLIATIPLRFAPKDIAAGAGAVWLTSQLDDTVSRIDPATNEVTATIPVGRGASGVAVGAGSVWVANAFDGTLSRIDPHTLSVETIDVEGSPDDVALGAGAVWVTAQAVLPSLGPRAGDTVRIGILAACEGDFGNLYDSSLAGAELPLLQRGARLAGTKAPDGVEDATAAGKDVKLFFGCTDGTGERALSEARRLVEVAGVDVLIGPFSIGEEFAIQDYAQTQPMVTFVNGLGGSQAVTLSDPAPNFFSFFTDGAQWMAGLGTYAYKKLGWRRVVTIGETRGFTFTHTAGFVAEFCSLGGTIVKQIWVPFGAQDLSPYLAEVPSGRVDGFLMAGFAPTILGFAKKLPQLEGNLANRVIGGFVMGFPEIADALGDRLNGVAFADKPGLGDPSRPEWVEYLSDFERAFPKLAAFAGFPTAVAYYNSMEAALEALEAVDGDLSGGQRRFQAALAHVELDAPEGDIRLDERRQAVGSSFVIQLQLDRRGKLNWKPLRTVENVEQTFNGYFRPGDPPPGKDTIECKHGNPPPWARSG